MMKKSKCLLLVFLLLALGHTQCLAQEKVQGVIVELSTGEVIEYRLVDHPKLVFDGTTVTFTTDGVKVEYKPTELAKVKTGEVANNSSSIFYNSSDAYFFNANDSNSIYQNRRYLALTIRPVMTNLKAKEENQKGLVIL